MRIYDINPTDGTVIDPAGREAPLDPMRGEPRVPRNAMTVEPPETGEREVARAVDNETWEVVPDWRGHVYWTADGQRHEITEIGIEPPAGALDEAPPEPLADLAAAAMSRINAGYSAAIAKILAEYPDAETLSFDKQESQAREWQAWHDAGAVAADEPATPYLDSMLAERPIGKEELVGRIIKKADQFSAAHGQATGRRQRIEDEVKAALESEDREGIEAVEWSEG